MHEAEKCVFHAYKTTYEFKNRARKVKGTLKIFDLFERR